MRRVDALQADRAIWGLTAHEQCELDQLLREFGEEPDPSWEYAASAATVAVSCPVPSLPSSRLLDSIRRAAPLGVPDERAVLRESPAVQLRVPWRSRLLAAAAVLVAAWLWVDRPGRQPAPDFERQALLEAGNTSVLAWTRGESPLSGGASGDVVWNPDQQRGFMRFRNLPANDPKKQQYQLWIFDADRSDAHPVDGGVFDIPDGQEEVVIAIDPKIVVFKAAAFVVTVENAGGTVVSNREHIVALAKP